MKKTQIAKIYANSMIAIAKENSIDLVGEFDKVIKLLNASDQLEVVMFMDVFKIEDKILVLKDVSEKISLNKVVENFVSFIISERRMGIFHQIYKEIVVADDREKGFLSGTIEGNTETLDESFKEKLNTYLEKRLGKKVNFKYEVNKNISAGYKVQVDDLLLDVSLENQLDKFKKQ